MRYKIQIILLILCVTIPIQVVAQPSLKKESKRAIAFSEDSDLPSTKKLHQNTGMHAGVKDEPVFFNPPVYNIFRTRPMSLPPYFKIAEDVKVDSIWLKYQDYYSVWNMTRLNPYGIDGLKWNDTVNLRLLDTLKGENWAFPLNRSIITSDFGLRRARWHYGTDLRVKNGEPVFAAFDGIVRILLYDRYGFGRFILIRHKNGLETIYGHLYRFKVRIGEEVKAGDLIGLAGNSGRSTAPHLHFEIRYAGNAINPHNIFDFEKMELRNSEYEVTPPDFAYLEEARKIIQHKVRYGETLSGIGYRYGVSVRQLCRLNNMNRDSILRTGRILRIK